MIEVLETLGLQTEDEIALLNFNSYLQIPSVQPNVNYDTCVEFLGTMAESLQLPMQVLNLVEGKPIVLMTWMGTEPALPAILLNSHIDVSPVVISEWSHNPFAVEIEDQNIYARGAQDSKCIGIQYLEAVRRLKRSKTVLKRTIYLSYMPDAEIGGLKGMGAFTDWEDFGKLNIGFALDSGMATLGDKFVAFNGEKYAWNIRVCCQGTSGDAELLLDDTPGERMSRVLQKFFAFRTMEMEKLTANPDWTLANVISINLTKIEGGGRRNMVPSEFVLYFDCRIPFERMDVDELEPTMDQWCHDVSNSVLIDYTLQELPINPTRINDPYWVTFEKAVEEVEVQMFPGRTDSRHLRNAEIPVVSFSPIINTPVRLHGHDEHIGIQTFLDGITIYCRILRELGELME